MHPESPLPLETLLEMLHEASSRGEIAPVLDRLLAYVTHESATPIRIAILFERLDPSRLARSVSQTLLASTRMLNLPSVERRKFLMRFLEHLGACGTSEVILLRLRAGLDM